MNKCLFVVNVTQDAKVNEAGTVLNFTGAATRKFKNKEGKYDSDFMKFKLLGEKAVAAYREKIVKGAKFEVEASFRNENYEKDGQKVYDYSFVVDNLWTISGPKSTSNDGPADTTPADGFVSVADDSGLPWAQ